MKRVYRSRSTRILGGVAGGLGDYFNIDVTIMRLAFAFFFVTLPNSIVAYIIAWIIIPEEPLGGPVVDMGPAQPAPPPQAPDIGGEPGTGSAPASEGTYVPVQSGGQDRTRQFFGVILVVIGSVVLVKRVVPSFVWRLPGRLFSATWPALIILLGVGIIYSAVRGK